MKLELHKLLNQFWLLRRSKRITSMQADLYYFLVQECNAKYWENPFECTNVLIKASIGISEPSLIDARNRLKQLGLIDFVGGKRNESSPVYQLVYLNNLSKNRGESLVNPLVKTEVNDVPIKRQQTKPNQTKLSSSGAEAPVIKKTIEDTTEHWQSIVKTWFTFYQQKFDIEPSFNGEAAKNLKSIVQRLKKHSESKGYEWSEKYAEKVMLHFLSKAYEDTWLQKNFLLSNLSSKFDVIVNPNKKNGTEQSTGANVSTQSAFSKIDKMFTTAGVAGAEG